MELNTSYQSIWGLCKTHKDNIRYLDGAEQSFLCSTCLVKNRISPDLLKNLDDLCARKKTIEEAHKTFSDYKKSIQNLFTDTKRNLIKATEDKFRDFRTVLQKKKEGLISEIHFYFEQESRKVEERLLTYDEFNAQLEKTIIEYNELIKSRDILSIIKEKEDISELILNFDREDINTSLEQCEDELGDIIEQFLTSNIMSERDIFYLEAPFSKLTKAFSTIYPRSKGESLVFEVGEPFPCEIVTSFEVKFDGDVLELNAKEKEFKTQMMTLEKLESVQEIKLNLKGFGFNKKDMEFIDYIWKRIGHIKTVQLVLTNHKEISTEQFDNLVKIIFWRLQGLQELELDFGRSKVTDKHIAILTEEYLPRIPCLKKIKLNFYCTEITESTLLSLASKTFPSMKALSSLTIDFGGVKIKINDTGEKFIQEGDKIILNIKYVPDQITDFFKNIPINLKELTLGFNDTQIGDQPLGAFAKDTLLCLEQLESLKLDLRNAKLEDSTIRRMFNSLDNLKDLQMNLQSIKGLKSETINEFYVKRLLAMEPSLKKLNIELKGTDVNEEAKKLIKDLEMKIQSKYSS